MATQELNEKQIDILLNRKKDLWGQYNYISGALIPLIGDGLRQIRSLTKDIALISAAIATFYLPVLTTEIVQTKFFAFMALFYLFFAIIYAIYHLSEVLPKEIDGLVKQQKIFGGLLFGEIDKVNKVLTGEGVEILKHSEEDKGTIESKLNSLKVESKPDKSLDNLRVMLLLAFIFIILSFINFTNLLDISRKSLEFLGWGFGAGKNLFKLNF